jgi:hypothetical protein
MSRQIIAQRKSYTAWLNLMDKLGFSSDDKQVGKSLVRPYLRLIEPDLRNDGDFDVVDDG